MKILLVQLASNGDCLFVTTIAKQIKEIDFPNSELTWMIGSKYRQVLVNNPHVDHIVEIPIHSNGDIQLQRNQIQDHLNNLNRQQKYDRIFVTDFTKSNFKNWFGTTRSSLFRSYPFKLKTDPRPLIFLEETEKKEVLNFCIEHNITSDTFNILFECSPQSGQSLMTFEVARKIAEEFTAINSNVKFILSSNKSFDSDNVNIIDGSKVSWRGNLELLNHCDLLIGCSSGISWLCTSQGAKSVPMIQIVSANYLGRNISASMKADYMYFGLDQSKLIELADLDNSKLSSCISLIIENRIPQAKLKFDQLDHSAFVKLGFLFKARITLSTKAYIFFRILKENSLLSMYRANKPYGYVLPKFIRSFLKLIYKSV